MISQIMKNGLMPELRTIIGLTPWLGNNWQILSERESTSFIVNGTADSIYPSHQSELPRYELSY